MIFIWTTLDKVEVLIHNVNITLTQFKKNGLGKFLLVDVFLSRIKNKQWTPYNYNVKNNIMKIE